MPNSRWNGSTKSDFHFLMNISLKGFIAESFQSWSAGAEAFCVAAQLGTVNTPSVSPGRSLSGAGTAASAALADKRIGKRRATLLISLGNGRLLAGGRFVWVQRD